MIIDGSCQFRRNLQYIGDISRFKNASALAKFAGVAPVTFASGMTKLEFANEKGNRQLNEILFHIAKQAVMRRSNGTPPLNPIFYEYYHKKLKEGKTKSQAMKCVQRRLVNIIYNIMKHKRPYVNPEMITINEDSALISLSLASKSSIILPTGSCLLGNFLCSFP